MELSFIIPVYNGADSVEKCIASIQKWDYEPKIEILVVDDGSTDETAYICKKIAQADDRVKLFSIPNSGQGIARNYGMEQSRGRYFWFVDADDTIAAEEVFQLWKIAQRERADVVMGAYFRVRGTHGERIHLAGEGFLSRTGSRMEQKLYHKVKTESAFGYVWNKLYRAEFLRQSHVQFEDIRKVFMEDQLFNLKVWSKHPVWYCCDRAVYFYQTANESTTRKAEPQIHLKNLAMLDSLINELYQNRNLEENLDIVIPLVMRTFCWSLIKNIAYEGRDADKIRERAEAYMSSWNVQMVIRMKGAVQTLWKLPSVYQAAFYSLCLLWIRRRQSKSAAAFFQLCYPVMKRYAAGCKIGNFQGI